MVNKRTWEEFRASGLLWWINMILHTFGWAIVTNVNIETNEVVSCYPARVKFRGFEVENNTEGYIKVTEHLNENIEELLKEAKE